GIRDFHVTGVQTCALPICPRARRTLAERLGRRPLVGATVREPGERILRRFPAEFRADRLGDAAAESAEPPLARRPLLGADRLQEIGRAAWRGRGGAAADAG